MQPIKRSFRQTNRVFDASFIVITKQQPLLGCESLGSWKKEEGAGN